MDSNNQTPLTHDTVRRIAKLDYEESYPAIVEMSERIEKVMHGLADALLNLHKEVYYADAPPECEAADDALRAYNKLMKTKGVKE